MLQFTAYFPKLIDEFVQGYYGDAAPFISEYLTALHQKFEQSDSVLTSSPPITPSYMNFDLMRQADEWFEQAEEAVANDPVSLDHVQKACVEVDYVTLMRGVEFMEEATDRGIDWNYDFDNRYARFKTSTADVSDYIAGTNISELYKEIEVGRTVPTVPDFVRNLPKSDWVDIQDHTFKLYTPVGAKIVQDPQASDNAAAKVTGKTNAWAIQVNNIALPREGMWKLYANVRIDPGTGSPGDKVFENGIYPPLEQRDGKIMRNSLGCTNTTRHCRIITSGLRRRIPRPLTSYMWIGLLPSSSSESA